MSHSLTCDRWCFKSQRRDASNRSTTSTVRKHVIDSRAASSHGRSTHASERGERFKYCAPSLHAAWHAYMPYAHQLHIRRLRHDRRRLRRDNGVVHTCRYCEREERATAKCCEPLVSKTHLFAVGTAGQIRVKGAVMRRPERDQLRHFICATLTQIGAAHEPAHAVRNERELDSPVNANTSSTRADSNAPIVSIDANDRLIHREHSIAEALQCARGEEPHRTIVDITML